MNELDELEHHARRHDDDDEERHDQHDREELLEQIEHRRQQLRRNEELMRRAADRGRDEEVEELSRMQERLTDELAELERHSARHDDDERQQHDGHSHRDELEHHAMSLEIHSRELEIQKMRLELEASRQEVAARTAKLAGEKYAFFAYSLDKVVGSSHDPHHAAEVVRGLIERTSDTVARRILQSKLAELRQAVGHHEEAQNALMSILSGDDDRKVRKLKRIRTERTIDSSQRGKEPKDR